MASAPPRRLIVAIAGVMQLRYFCRGCTNSMRSPSGSLAQTTPAASRAEKGSASNSTPFRFSSLDGLLNILDEKGKPVHAR